MNSKLAESVHMDQVDIDGEPFLKISNLDKMRPFFMSIVSNSDHWMFISSNGSLSAGRKNAEYALFPYYTDDKITDLNDVTGNKTIFQIENGNDISIWEPFSDRNARQYSNQRHLYKSVYGNKIVFEEVNHDLKLVFSYTWSTSNTYGFVKQSKLRNLRGNNCKIRLLDGVQNILPYGVGSDIQNQSSNLVDAYKRNEIHSPSGVGIYALSAIIVDKAEPSEALKANIVWSIGLDHPIHLLSSNQLDTFRTKGIIYDEKDIKGEKGAYFIVKDIALESQSELSWYIVADVNKTQSQVIKLCHDIKENKISASKLRDDIKSGTENLLKLVASSDGLQYSNDRLQDIRHYSNVLFNIMRGGVFDNNYAVETADFVHYLETANKEVEAECKSIIDFLGHSTNYQTLVNWASESKDSDLIRLAIEYLPLKFSRRHGDPSRPWNKFSINIRDEKTGSKVLDYEGNWRDIFQNWEALAYSYPNFIDGMIFKFLNASTFDGYNPYRVTKDGFDWEVIEPDDPWSYIGYWGDHQIIYLQKFLEIIDSFSPGRLESWISKDIFVYAAVPYIIKSYDEITINPKDTIEFDVQWDNDIREKRRSLGADGALLRDSSDNIYRVNLIEKLLTTALSKLSNFVPEGGIWMNTQRPEWNDANNALVGNGVSLVTLCYLRRFLKFFNKLISRLDITDIKLSNELVEFYHTVREIFNDNIHLLSSDIDDQQRKIIMDGLGQSASDYRHHIYKSGFWGKKRTVSLSGLKRFTDLSLSFIEHTLNKNRRKDNLFHAYNLMTYSEEGVRVSRLDEMLEGQVAILSSGYLGAEDSLQVLDALKSSALFRPDQYSYILYPNKDLLGFLERNTISTKLAQSSVLIKALEKDGNTDIVERDIYGDYHFNGHFKNSKYLKEALDRLEDQGYKDLVKKDKALILDIYEKVFNHKAFTGRSGTFFAFEGLGSIYWHMVSKLLLAVQECCVSAIANEEDPKVIGSLLDHYYEIRAGIGVHKEPDLYGAFPTDPYSHTPLHKGAQQPGMTGQVKEDILTRFVELGVVINNGELSFDPCLLRQSEFTSTTSTVEYYNVNGIKKQLELNRNQLFFSFCQVPCIYTISDINGIEVSMHEGRVVTSQSLHLSRSISESVFSRDGSVELINISINKSSLK